MRRLLCTCLLSFSLTTGCAALHKPSSRGDDVPALAQGQLLELADLLAQRGDSVRAQQYLLLAEKQGAPSDQVLPRLLKLYVADGQYRLAIEHAEHCLRRRPSDTRLRELVASLYAAVGYNDAAVTAYEAVLRSEPNNAHVHYSLAALLRELGGEYVRIDRHYRAYLTLDPRGEHAEEARAGLLEALP